MKKVLRLVYKILGLAIFICVAAGTIDYFRVRNNDFPIFTMNSFDNNTNKQTFQGPFYKITRIVTISKDESFPISKSIKYTAIIFDVPIERTFPKKESYISIKTTEEPNNSSKLYYYNNNLKVYLFNIKDIKLKMDNHEDTLENYLKQDTELIDKIINVLYVSNVYKDNSIRYIDIDELQVSNNGLALIKCSNSNIYIGPRTMILENDICTLKDDIPRQDNPENQ